MEDLANWRGNRCNSQRAKFPLCKVTADTLKNGNKQGKLEKLMFPKKQFSGKINGS